MAVAIILIVLVLLGSQLVTANPSNVELTFVGGSVHVADFWQVWTVHWSDGHEDKYSSAKTEYTQILPALGLSGPFYAYPEYVIVATNIQYVSALPNNPPVDYFITLNTNFFSFQFNSVDITPSAYPTPTVTYTSDNATGTVTYYSIVQLYGPLPTFSSPILLPPVNATVNYASGGSTFTLKVTVTENWDARKCAYGTTNCTPLATVTKSNLLSKVIQSFAGVVTTTITSVTGTKTATSTVTTIRSTSSATTTVVSSFTSTQTLPRTTQTIALESLTYTLTQPGTTYTVHNLITGDLDLGGWLRSSPYLLPNAVWIAIAAIAAIILIKKH